VHITVSFGLPAKQGLESMAFGSHVLQGKQASPLP